MKDRAILKFLASTGWACTPEHLELINTIVSNHIQGLPVKMESPKSKVSGNINYPQVAIIGINGTIAKKFYGMDAISGAKTTLDYREEIQAALDDPNIKGIVLDIDSNGGTVDGTKELTDFIYESRGSKPIIAYANGSMNSAAYWIGSAADKIVAYDTAKVGSIGVVMAHYDYSEMLKEQGIAIKYLYAGKYKVAGNSTEPLSKEGEEYLQGSIDYYYSMFVDSVAQYRAKDPNFVLTKQAEGRVFIGKQALDVELIDELGGIEKALALASQGETKNGGKKVTIKEAVKEFGVEALMKELSAQEDVPKEVADAITSSLTPKVEIPAEFKAQFDAMQEQIKALEAEKTEKAEALAKEKAEREEKEHAEFIKSLIPNCNEELFSVLADLDQGAVAIIAGEVNKEGKKAKELAEKLEEPTEGAESKEKQSPETFDAAVSMIVKRDKVEYQEAAQLASTEFPELFDSYRNGGN